MLPFGLAGLIAVVLTAVGFVASGTAASQATFKAGLVSDVGRFNDKGFNQNQLTGMKKAHKILKIPYRAVRVSVFGRLPAEYGLAGTEWLQHRHLGGLPALGCDRGGGGSVPEHEVRYHRSSGRSVQEAALERRRLDVRDPGEQLPHRLPGGEGCREGRE
jgi:hypothetical protein